MQLTSKPLWANGLRLKRALCLESLKKISSKNFSYIKEVVRIIGEVGILP
jgi:hypothetical protein